METLNIVTPAASASKLTLFRAKAKPSTRALLAQCDLLLTDDTLEIHTKSKIIGSRLCALNQSLARLATVHLGVTVINIKHPDWYDFVVEYSRLQ